MRAYEQSYTYDLQGNALELQHVATGGSFTRTYGLETVGAVETNRLSTLTVGSTTFDYVFDAAGQLVQENTERRHAWDAGGRLRSFRVQVYNSGMFVWDEPTVYARYLYDAAGSRVKKVTRVAGSLRFPLASARNAERRPRSSGPALRRVPGTGIEPVLPP